MILVGFNTIEINQDISIFFQKNFAGKGYLKRIVKRKKIIQNKLVIKNCGSRKMILVIMV